MKVNLGYLIAFVILFVIEVLIAIFAHDNFIRDYAGDVLVVILIYCFVKIFLKRKIKLLPLYVFLFTVIIEILQYINIVKLFQLGDNRVVSTMLGTAFDIRDILCYFTGALLLWFFQEYRDRI